MPNSVLREQAGAVATITINRPAARNALTNETKVSLLSALRDCSDDPGIRAVILTGAGEAFCAGQDLREHAEQAAAGGSPVDTVRDHYNPMVMTITGMAKPVIAALPGVAAGAGAALAFACDFRIAARRTRFAMAFAPIASSIASANTTVEWPSEKKNPTASGRCPSLISLRVVLSMAAMWSASKAWRRPSA